MSEPIRIAHISDTHLGFRGLGKTDPETGRNQRTVDFECAFEWAVDTIIEQRPDGIIHAGDVFHQSRPTWATLIHFVRQMKRIEDAGIPMLVIAGNHDTPRIRTGGSAYSLLEITLPRIKFYAGYEDKSDFETFQHLNMHVYTVPHGALTNDNPVVPSVIGGKINVMAIHGMARDILRPDVQAEPGEASLDSGLLSRDFDYIALGHFHHHVQPPGIGNGWYSGSTERTSRYDSRVETEFLRDMEKDKPGYAIVTLNGPGAGFEIEHIEYKDARPMIDLETTYADNMRGQEIADEIIRKIDEHETTPETFQRAMVRARIWNAERGDRRQAESILRRELGDRVWHLSIPQEKSEPNADPNRLAIEREFPDLRELFGQFVEHRNGTGFNERFAGIFRERGNQALADALAASSTVTPEEDELT